MAKEVFNFENTLQSQMFGCVLLIGKERESKDVLVFGTLEE